MRPLLSPAMPLAAARRRRLGRCRRPRRFRLRRLHLIFRPPGCGSRAPVHSRAEGPSVPGSWTRPPRRAGLLEDRQSQFEVGDVDRRLGVRGARVGRVGGQQLELRPRAPGRSGRPGGGAGRPCRRRSPGRSRPRATSARCRPGETSRRRAASSDSPSGGGEVGDDRRGAEEREAGRRERPAGGSSRPRPGRRRRRWRRRLRRRSGRISVPIVGSPEPGHDRLLGGAVEADLAGRRAPSRSAPCRGLRRRRRRWSSAPRRWRRRRAFALQVVVEPGVLPRQEGFASSAALFWLRACPSSMKKSEIGSPGYWVRVRL